MDAIRNHIMKNFLESASEKKEKFCQSFTLIARFAGWRWRCKDVEISFDDICATYEMLVTNCITAIIGMTPSSTGQWSFSTSTGRINFNITYYGHMQTVHTDITVDIA